MVDLKKFQTSSPPNSFWHPTLETIISATETSWVTASLTSNQSINPIHLPSKLSLIITKNFSHLSDLRVGQLSSVSYLPFYSFDKYSCFYSVIIDEDVFFFILLIALLTLSLIIRLNPKTLTIGTYQNTPTLCTFHGDLLQFFSIFFYIRSLSTLNLLLFALLFDLSILAANLPSLATNKWQLNDNFTSSFLASKRIFFFSPNLFMIMCCTTSFSFDYKSPVSITHSHLHVSH